VIRTKIVCTIGPASRDQQMLRQLLLEGMNVARLNFSHGGQEFHGENIARLRQMSAEVNRPVAILVDLQGPKLRVGEVESDGVRLSAGEEILLTTDTIIGKGAQSGGEPARIPLQYVSLPREVNVGDRILIDDGLMEIQVLEAGESEIRCQVITGGLLRSNKGLNLPDASLSIPAITPKDWDDLAFALSAGADWIALSFVRSAEEVNQLKARIAELCEFGRPVPVIAKIEKPEALKQIDAIIAAADAIMVARGDLGIETAPEKVPLAQKTIILKCNAAGIPVITATQMLDSMIRNPRPTRAEASDVANAILDGTDAVMLSGETAAGLYPLESLRTMVRIAREVESSQSTEWAPPTYIPRRAQARRPRRDIPAADVTDALSHATCETAHDLGVAAIVSATASGRTAQAVARYRPVCPVIAVTPSPMVQRRLLLVRGVWPLLGRRAESTDGMLDEAIESAVQSGLIHRGDTVVITAGISPNMPGSTDLMKVETIPEVLAEGTGVLEAVVSGRVRCLEVPTTVSIEEIDPSEILVAARTDRTLIPLVRRAAGFITEEGGIGCHAYNLAMELGVPAIVGVRNAVDRLRDGRDITMDTRRGLIMAGHHTV
jgi:pyruvate kinase